MEEDEVDSPFLEELEIVLVSGGEELGGLLLQVGDPAPVDVLQHVLHGAGGGVRVGMKTRNLRQHLE